jgi:hypothetical protein
MLGNQLGKLNSILADFPPQIKTFLIRSFILFVVWKGLYLLFWSEQRTIDDPLTQIVSKHSVWVLNTLVPDHQFTSKPKIALKNFEGEIQVSRVSMIYSDGKAIMIGTLHSLFWIFIGHASIHQAKNLVWFSRNFYHSCRKCN